MAGEPDPVNSPPIIWTLFPVSPKAEEVPQSESPFISTMFTLQNTGAHFSWVTGPAVV